MKTRSIPIRSIPIKVRLTAWYFIVMAIAMSALGALALAGMEHSIRSTVDEQLVARIDVVKKLIDDVPPTQSPARLAVALARESRAGQRRRTRPNSSMKMETASSSPLGSRAAPCSRPPVPRKCKKSGSLFSMPKSAASLSAA